VHLEVPVRGRAFFSVLLFAGAALAVGPQSAGAPSEDEETLWRAARNALSAETIWRYLDRFPKGVYTDGARQRLAKLGTEPGRRFDGHWSGELRCASGWEWLRLPLDVEIEDGRVQAGAANARFHVTRIEPNGTIELEGESGPVGGPLGQGGPHEVWLEALITRPAIDARGVLGPLLCVMELQRSD
jgi:hypothetical protein